jgi:hypothetical protein
MRWGANHASKRASSARVGFVPTGAGLNQIREYLNDIELALEMSAVYSALALSLALPDIMLFHAFAL